MMRIPRISWKHWRIDAIGLAIVAALGVGAYTLQIQPMLHSRQAHATLTTDLAARQQKTTELKDTLRSAVARRATAQRSFADSNISLEPASQLNQRILRLTELATESGLVLDAIEPGKPSHGARYEAFPIHLSGRGDYRNCTKFLKNLQAKLRDSGVTRLELSASPGINAPATGGFAFDLIWYTAPAHLADTK
jgi:Tfp pilus assembly protein PilO